MFVVIFKCSSGPVLTLLLLATFSYNRTCIFCNRDFFTFIYLSYHCSQVLYFPHLSCLMTKAPSWHHEYVCAFAGVSLHESGHVAQLKLTANGLVGDLPGRMLKGLPKLEVISGCKSMHGLSYISVIGNSVQRSFILIISVSIVIYRCVYKSNAPLYFFLSYISFLFALFCLFSNIRTPHCNYNTTGARFI